MTEENCRWDWKYMIIVFGSGPENGPSIDALNKAENAARDAVGGDRSIARLAFADSTIPLMYADLDPDSRTRYPIQPTVEAIQHAEQSGLVAPDPETFARRNAIINAR